VSDDLTTGVGVEPDGHGHDGATRTPVPLPVASARDPHLQVSAKNPQRTESLIALLFVVGIAGMVAFGVVYWINISKYWAYGLTLGVGLAALGAGLTAWGKYLMPQGPFVEERHVLRSSDEERDAFSAALVQRTDLAVSGRRGFLGILLALGLGIFGITAIGFPLLRSLGPRPGNALFRTNWKAGSLLVDSGGRPVHRDDIEVGGIVTVFPSPFEQGSSEEQSKDQVVLLRPQLSPHYPDMPRGRETWTPAGYIAYSKMCTHLGCPVGLYEQQLQLLVCPCHQSMFNIYDGAVPQFGPAARALPQLPLYVDADGNLRAQRGFDQPVGPSFWERTTKPEWHW